MINGSFESGIPISHVNILIGSPSDQRSHHTQYIHSLAKYLQIKILLLILGAWRINTRIEPTELFLSTAARLSFNFVVGVDCRNRPIDIPCPFPTAKVATENLIVRCRWVFVNAHCGAIFSASPPLQFALICKSSLSATSIFFIDHTKCFIDSVYYCREPKETIDCML